MTRMFIRHPVSDYDAWRKVYDDFGETQQKLGVRAESVHRDVENASMLTVIHDFDSADDARSFVASDELKEAMGNAGVAGPPDVWITEAG